MRLEGDEAVEQRLNHVGPLLHTVRSADADVIEGESFGGGFLDLMPEQKSARGLPQAVVGERAKDGAHAAMADRAAEGREHRVVHLEIAEPEPAGIVALEQSKLAVEGAGMRIEDILDAHGGELTGLLGKERIDDLEPFVARLGLAVAKRPGLGEFLFFAVKHSPGVFAEPLLIKRREIAERDGIATAWSRLMAEAGERICRAVPTERLRLENGPRRAGDARDLAEQAEMSAAVKLAAALGVNNPML